MCGMCAGVYGCAWVCPGVLGCAQVCTGVPGCTLVCAGVHGCVQVSTGIHRYVGGCGWMGVDVSGCGQLCRMNFQNFFWRIESLHQRTLIRILYEFFVFQITKWHTIYSLLSSNPT